REQRQAGGTIRITAGVSDHGPTIGRCRGRPKPRKGGRPRLGWGVGSRHPGGKLPAVRQELARTAKRRCEVLVIAVLAFLPAAAWAQEPRTLAQYSHHRIEAPGTVVSVAQGPEGFLWIASSEGLFRYDGSRFERIAPGNRTLGHELPGVLLVTRSGEIWAHFASSGRFGVYRDG